MNGHFMSLCPWGSSKGVEGVRQLDQTIGAAFSDLHIEISAEYDVPGCSIREGVITAAHTGEYMGVPPSGNRARSAFAAFFVFDRTSGGLLGERLYLDHGALLEQLQGKKTAAAAQ
jgi:hypothetical protein